MKNLEDIILDEMANEMQKSLDYTILCDVMSRFGYTVIEIGYFEGQEWSEVKEWADQNCLDEHQEHMGKWLFKSEKDAIMFALKWKTE